VGGALGVPPAIAAASMSAAVEFGPLAALAVLVPVALETTMGAAATASTIGIFRFNPGGRFTGPTSTPWWPHSPRAKCAPWYLISTFAKCAPLFVTRPRRGLLISLPSILGNRA